MRAATIALVLTLLARGAHAEHGARKPRASRLALAATGLVALGATLLSISTRSRFRDLEETCAPSCAPDAVDDLRERAHVADAFWVATGVGAAATIGLYLWERRRVEAVPGALRVRW